MKWVCDNRSESQFKQLRKSPQKKDFGASTGFEPVASALVLQCSTSLNYEDPYTGGRPARNPFFGGAFSQLLKLRFTAMVTYSFHLYSRSSHHFILSFTRDWRRYNYTSTLFTVMTQPKQFTLREHQQVVVMVIELEILSEMLALIFFNSNANKT